MRAVSPHPAKDASAAGEEHACSSGPGRDVASPPRRPLHAGPASIAMAVLAVAGAAAVALAGAAAAPGGLGQDGAQFDAPWAAHAQQQPSEPVRIGAFMAPGGGFDDTPRILALRHAVGEFNLQGGGALLELVEYNFTRGNESAALEAAYGGGAGPSYYVGPTTSSGLSSIMGFANDSGIVLVSPASDAAHLAVPGDTTFRLTISVEKQARSLARIMSNASIDAAVTVIRDDAWGRSFNASLNDELGLRGVDLAASVPFADSGADWGAAAAAAGAAAADVAAAQGSPRAGIVFAGFGSDYREMAAAAASAGPGDAAAAARTLPWFAPSAAIEGSTLAPMANDTVRAFSTQVNLTALGKNVPPNAVTDRLDAALAPAGSDPERLTYYEYAAYDSLFVLGTAIGMVRDAAAGDGAPDPAAVAAAMPAAALAHKGALGRIALNPGGDLLIPDAFGVWRVDASGAWNRTGTAASGTPVIDIGMLAILAGGHEASRVAAARLAINEHNWARDAAASSGGGESHYLHLSVHNITVNDAPPRVLDVLRDAHAGGDGPSMYVGPSTSGNTKRVLDYANANGIVLVSPSATAPSLSIEGDNLFRLAPDDSRQGLVLANVIGRDLAAAGEGAAAGVVVVAARDDAWGRDLNRTAAERLAALGLDTVPIRFSERADWQSVAQRLNSAIDSAASGRGPAAVLFIGLAPDFRAIAPLAGDALPWYAPDSIAASRDVAGDAAASAFADRVNLTATLFNAPANAEQDRVRSALAKSGVSGLRTYDYSTYDSVSVLGEAIIDAWGSAGGGDAADVAAALPRAAAAYEGTLGDIELNSRGDLRSPNDYALWTMEDDAWKRIEVFAGTPVVEFGALVSLDGTPASDAARLAAMMLAVDEYNRAAEAAGGPMYIDLSVFRTSIVPAAATPSSPAAADALEAAYAAGAGPSYYIGPTTSGNAARVLGFADSNNITLISPSSTAASLAREGDALFRLAPNDALQGRILADIIHNRQGDILAGLIRGSGADAVVSLVRNDTWGRGLYDSASARLAAHGIPVTSILHAPHGANWTDAASDLDWAIGSWLDGGSPAVLHVGFQGDFAAIAGENAAGDHGRLASVPWYGTDGIARGSSVVSDPDSLALASATNLTATVFDAPASPRLDAVKSALAARGIASPGPYAYSSYDAVLVLAGAVEMAMESKGASTYEPADVRGMVRAAAAAHDGALGDIELNRAGDLRTPNGYATWTVEDGAWKRAGSHPPTPVFDVGALLVLGAGQPYTDRAELGVIEAAVDDFNTAHELVGDFYLDLEVRRIRASPGSGSADPGALAGLEAAHAGGAGPSYYVGPSSSANAARMLDYANRNGLVLVSPSSTDPSLAVPADALFRMIPDYTRHADALARLLGERGAAEVVLAVRDDAWGAGVNASVRSALGGLEAPPAVSQVSFAEDGADWAAVARKLGAAAQSAASRAAASSAYPAVVFAGFDGDLAALAARAAVDPDAARSLASVEWLGAGGISADPATLAGPGALDLAAAVNLTAVRFAPPATAIAAGLDPAATYGPSAYDSVRVLGAAIAAAYADSPNGTAPWGPAVGEEMWEAAAEYTGALGDLELDANGDLDHPATFGVYSVGAAAAAAGGSAWTLDRIIAPGAAGECPAGARCIAIGELYTAELGEAAEEIHEAYAMAAEDFNREQSASGASPRAHIVLQRAEVSLFSPLEGLEAAYDGGAGPAAYVGPITSSSALAMKPLIDKEGIVLVSPTSASTGGGLADADTLFRLALSDTYEADLLAISAGYEGVETLIPAVRGDAYGLSYESELRAEGRILGMAVSDSVVMEIDDSSPAHGLLDASADAADLNRLAAAAAASGTPASAVGIVVAGTTTDLHDLAHYAVEYPLLTEAKWFEPGNLYPPRPITDDETLELARTADLFSTQWDVPQTGRFNDVHDRLAARVGIEPHMHSYAAYDAVLLLADAVNRSMAADGSYAGPGVAAEVPAAAARLHGLLGDGLVLDAGGDRVSPSSVVLWKTEGGTGRWIDDGHLHLDPTCGIALRSPDLAFGDVRPGSPSGAAAQGVRAAGTAPVSGLDVHASPWTSAATGETVLPSGATQLLVGPDWTPLSGTVDLGGSGGAPLASWRDLSFRVSPGDSAAPATGQIVQSVTYAATCE